MNLLLQVSDPHFGAERPEVCDALLRLAQRERPHVLLMSGDLTQRARPAQFAAARRFADSLNVPHRLTLPGNHDIPLFDLASRLFRPYARYRRHFGPAHDGVLDVDGLRLIGLDSTRRLRHVDGELSDVQIARTAELLRSAPNGALRVVALHHPLEVGRGSERRNRVHGHEEAIREWIRAGADLMLGGHIHLPSVRRLEHAPRWSWAVLAGTAVSHRIRHDAGNSVNLLRRAGDRACIVERWDFRDASGAFELAALNALPLARHCR
ncbi:metallophosphoesterase family protein [Methyloversatilis thermotolerans]|uniref:metallophosphoesterase family protein n=1 Tax=Methyloversatilis thermotolerans TaxID=1346290 RepID=UPI0003734F81|nr:metallophosphoesterase [Methyloversatilis thermotolerans]